MSAPEYIDCELNLSNYEQAELRVGDVGYPGKPNLNPTELSGRLLEASLDAQLYGERLFDALFPYGSDLLAGYLESVRIALHDEKRLRLRLRIDINAPADLHALHWERLYFAANRLALARARDVVFSRYLTVNKPLPSPLDVKVPRMLVVVSSPSDLREYNLAVIEKDKITALLKHALDQLANQVQCEFLDGPATPAAIADRLAGNDFHALHLYAHGVTLGEEKKAYLVLEDEHGKANYADENMFSEVVEGARSLRLITLIACLGGVQPRDDPFSGLGPALVRMGFPAVIAMQQEVSTHTAEIFTEYFYRNLARTGQVDVSANAARRQILLKDKDTADWSNPVLFMRLADGKLWDSTATVEDQLTLPPVTADDSFDWRPILEWLPEGYVTPIIGPEINLGLLPLPRDIAELWAKDFEYDKYNYPLNDRNDLPRIAQFVETIKEYPKFPHKLLLNAFKLDLLEREKVQQREVLNKLPLSGVIEKLAQRHFDRDPNDPYEILARFPIPTYLTTNPDSFMTEALKFVDRTQSEREVALWQEDDFENEHYGKLRGTLNEPLVFHLYGTDRNAASLVLTEDDHLDFLRFFSKDSWRIPRYLKQHLTESVLLFLGYNIRNLDFRVVFKGLVGQLKRASPGRIAILQIQPDEDFQQQMQDLRLLQKFMEKDCANLKLQVYWGSVRKFLIGLRDQYENANEAMANHAQPIGGN